jgi:L-threonylcarbamoyladenylate synthase
VIARLGVEEAVAALGRGEVVALPTDTVYGLGASLAWPGGVGALFEIKRRPSSSALPVVAASRDALGDLITGWPPPSRRLAERLWPGALTLVVPATREVCDLVRSTSGRVGFRVPDDDVLAEVLRASGPLALTSANEHGEAPCVTADEVAERFAGSSALAGVLDAGRRDDPVSTVVEFPEGTWRITRLGALGPEAVAAVIA